MSGKQVYFNPDYCIPFSQTNFPQDALTFKPHRVFYWVVEMEKFGHSDKKLSVKVLDYHAQSIDKFNQQVPKYDVQFLEFAPSLDWKLLEPQLSYYTKLDLLPLLPNEKVESDVDDLRREFPNNLAPQTIQHTLHIKLEVPFTDARFHLGYVSFQKELQGFDHPVDFKIENDFLLPEFDHIKFWFAKKLGTRKFKVQAAIYIVNGEIASIQADSQEIKDISPDLIDLIKQQRTLNLIKLPGRIHPDKALFTPEDIFDQLSDDSKLQGNVFQQSESNILEFLLDNKDIRNRKQLVYLSGIKQSDKHKLRFTLAPHFGFLFLIEGEKCNHFIWERLNSHATYIWSIGKSEQEIKLQYNRIEQTINAIRTAGREAYRYAYRESHIDHDLLFTVLEHTHASSALVDGFPKWKHRLNELLV